MTDVYHASELTVFTVSRAVFEGDQPTLSAAQLGELKLDGLSDRNQNLDLYVQLIFRMAAASLVAQTQRKAALAKPFHTDLTHLRELFAATAEAIATMDPAIGPLLQHQAIAMNPIEAKVLGGPSAIEHRLASIGRELDLMVAIIERIDVRPQRGASKAVFRQMVRGLAGLIADVTGDMPHRAYRAVGPDGDVGTGEDYPFLRMAQTMARFVIEALPPGMPRPQVPALTGIVREELDRLAQEKEAAPRSPMEKYG